MKSRKVSLPSKKLLVRAFASSAGATHVRRIVNVNAPGDRQITAALCAVLTASKSAKRSGLRGQSMDDYTQGAIAQAVDILLRSVLGGPQHAANPIGDFETVVLGKRKKVSYGGWRRRTKRKRGR